MKKILFIALAALAVYACNPYEYGPNVSLRTKKGRISNDWVVDIVKKNGIPLSAIPDVEYKMVKDGSINKTEVLMSSAGTDSVVTKSGLWEFDNDAENVIVLFADRYGITESHIWRILKLTKDEFWYEEVDSIDLYEYRLKEK